MLIAGDAPVEQFQQENFARSAVCQDQPGLDGLVPAER